MPSFFDFLDQEAPQAQAAPAPSPSPAPVLPTIRPKKTPEEIAAARLKVKDLLDEAFDFDSMAGGMPPPKYPVIQEPATVGEMRQRGNIQPGPLDELSEFVNPTGKTVEQTQYTPVEDPRRAEYLDLARKRKSRAEKIARDHGFDASEVYPAGKPEIRQVPQEIQPIEAPPQAETSPEALMKAHGVPIDEQYRGLMELADKMQVNPDERVNFGVGLSRVLSDPSNADLRAEFTDFFRRIDSPQPQQQAQSGTMGAQPLSQSQIEEQNLRADMKELGKLDELQDWGSVLTFVLLSMLIGPQLSFLFFSNAAKKGKLKREMELRKENLKRFRDQEKVNEERQYDEQRFYRELAAKSAVRGQEQKMDFKHRLFIRATDSAQKAIAIATKEGNKEKEQYIKEKKAQFNRAITLAKATGMPAFGEDAPKFLELAKSLAEELDVLAGVAAEEKEETEDDENEGE